MTRFGFVSTYPPTPCGLATFTSSLRAAMVRDERDTAVVVRLLDVAEPRPGTEVVAQVTPGDRASFDRAAQHLNACDVVVVQHEYGIFGGRDGDDVLGLLDRLLSPTVVVLHTVLTAPTTHQRHVLEAVVDKASRAVVMTQTAHDRLAAHYDVQLDKIRVIPHGAPDISTPTNVPIFRNGQFTALTWGLLGPGKGIEWAIEAMSMLPPAARSARYMVAGRTHPKVLQRSGEAYRNGLVAQVDRLGLQQSVSFDSRYRDAASLADLLRASDVVVLPYDSTEQVTSGVLIEAVAAHKPVIATNFPHARELLADGGGVLVDHGNPGAIAEALVELATHRDVVAGMSAAARGSSAPLLWSNVAEQYRRLSAELAADWTADQSADLANVRATA